MPFSEDMRSRQADNKIRSGPEFILVLDLKI